MIFSGLHNQFEDVAVCAGSLLLHFGRFRYLCNFDNDRAALRFSKYGLDRLLVERHLAVFGVHRQIGVGLVGDVLDKAYFQRKLYAVRTLGVRCRYLENDLYDFFSAACLRISP